MKKSLSFLLLVLVASCATPTQYYWVKEGFNSQDFAKDQYQCQREAYALTQPQPKQEINIKVGNESNKTGMLGDYSLKPFDPAEVMKRRQELYGRQSLIDNCLRAQGWQLMLRK